MQDISNTWVIINIGKKSYALNSSYVDAITDLKNENYVAKNENNFVKGIYSIFSVNMPIIDGYKMSSQNSTDESKLEFSKTYNSCKVDYMLWMDSLELIIMRVDEPNNESFNNTNKILGNWIVNGKEYSDAYLNKLLGRVKDAMEINLSRGNRLVETLKAGELTVTQASKEMDEIRKYSDRHILGYLDDAVDYYCSKVSEMCIVVKVKNKVFGISIDSIKMITEATEISNKRKTTISAGIVTIEGTEYTILDLTKLSRII